MFGITAAAECPEMELHDVQYLQPFDEPRLLMALQRQMDDPDRLRDALRDVLARYRQLRRKGLHDGPPLLGLRLYHCEWRLDARAGNANQPDRKELVAEVGCPREED